MTKIIVYLIESGLCLSLLFLFYHLLLKKETYFQFNRVYLIAVVVISSLIPFARFSLTFDKASNYSSYFEKIGQIKTSYSEIIESNNRNISHSNSVLTSDSGSGKITTNSENEVPELRTVEKSESSIWSFIHIILLVYFAGVTFLLIRFAILFSWLYNVFRSSEKEISDAYTIVNVHKDIAPFSFFKYIFISKQNIKSAELGQIIEHEKIHAKQNHSLDLLLTQLLCILHWYNPIVWIMLKAVKTNHEFIADQMVISNGYNKYDYQELLLKQFISFPTIKVVNNLNLTSIKNRIKMMNKFKSGSFAKLKAILIIPVAVFVFLIFSNLTIHKNSNINLLNNNANHLQGMWQNKIANNYGKYVLFDNTKFSILENDNTLKEYPYTIADDKIIISLPDNQKASLKYEQTNNKLKIWWGNKEMSEFNKSDFDNTLDELLDGYNINLPVVSNYRVLKNPELCITVITTNNKYVVNGIESTSGNLKTVLNAEKEKMNPLFERLTTVIIYNDVNIPMQMVTDLKQTLREIGLLKICYMGIAEDNKVSKLEMRYVGIPRKLPPLMGTKNAEVLEIIPDSLSAN